jgi:hypothetical protein
VFHAERIRQLQGFLCEFHRICCIAKQGQTQSQVAVQFLSKGSSLAL